jgi:hypothetical protein
MKPKMALYNKWINKSSVSASASASAAASAAFCRRRRRPCASRRHVVALEEGRRKDSCKMSDGRKDSCKMSEKDKKKKKCDYCQVPNFTKYDCQTCDR